MSKYPLSCLDGSASDAFKTVLSFHLPAGGRVIDLTYGAGISWGQPGLFDVPVELTKNDVKLPDGVDIFDMRVRPEWAGAFDLAFYDPPWFVDIESASDDPRAAAYGGYGRQARTLDDYIALVDGVAWLLRPGGKVIVKCSDQFHVPTRRLLLHHVRWCERVARTFDVVDFYVYRYHRGSPTAYQVKDRPSSVITHSYFIVGQDRRAA